MAGEALDKAEHLDSMDTPLSNPRTHRDEPERPQKLHGSADQAKGSTDPRLAETGFCLGGGSIRGR